MPYPGAGRAFLHLATSGRDVERVRSWFPAREDSAELVRRGPFFDLHFQQSFLPDPPITSFVDPKVLELISPSEDGTQPTVTDFDEFILSNPYSNPDLASRGNSNANVPLSSATDRGEDIFLTAMGIIDQHIVETRRGKSLIDLIKKLHQSTPEVSYWGYGILGVHPSASSTLLKWVPVLSDFLFNSGIEDQLWYRQEGVFSYEIIPPLRALANTFHQRLWQAEARLCRARMADIAKKVRIAKMIYDGKFKHINPNPCETDSETCRIAKAKW